MDHCFSRKTASLRWLRLLTPLVLFLGLQSPAYGQQEEKCYRGDPTDAPGEVRAMGTPPVIALVGDGMISAGFSAEGRMTTFFYPTVGAYDMVPYYTSKSGEDPLYGAKEYFGALAGIVSFESTEPRYLWQSKEKIAVTWLTDPTNISHDEKFPAFTFLYEKARVQVQIKVYALIDRNTVAYSITFKNNDRKRRLGFAYYAFFDPSKVNQRPIVDGLPSLCSGWYSPSLTRVRYSNGNLIWRKDDVGYAIGMTSDIPIGSLTYVHAGRAKCHPFQIENAGVYRDAYVMGGWGSVGGVPQGENSYEWPDVQDLRWELTTLNGVMIWDLGEMDTGGSRTFHIYVSAGEDRNAVESVLIANRQYQNHESDVRAWWRDFLAPVEEEIIQTHRVLPNDEKYLKWWTMTLRLLADRNTGAIVGAPLLIPQYYGCWLRDGAYQAITWIELGYDEIARKFFEYLFSMRDFNEESRWYMCYDSSDDPSYVGFRFNCGSLPVLLPMPELGYYDKGVLEEDQMSLVLVAIGYYYRKFNVLPVDRTLIAKLADYIFRTIVDGDIHETTNATVSLSVHPLAEGVISSLNDLTLQAPRQFSITYHRGLVLPSSDQYEFPGEITGYFNIDDILGTIDIATSCPGMVAARQSPYVNFAAVAALNVASELLGDDKYRKKADDLRTAAEEFFWREPGENEGVIPVAKGTKKTEKACRTAEKHFFDGYDLFTHTKYGVDDNATKYVWPLQICEAWDGSTPTDPPYSLPDKVFLSCLASGKRYQAQCARLFVPNLLQAQIYGLVLLRALGSRCSGAEAEGLTTDYIQEMKTAGGINSRNDYLPEFLKSNYSTWETNTFPIGWSHALGIHVLLLKSPPGIIGTEPGNDALAVSLAPEITATFDQDMDGSTINTNTFGLREAFGDLSSVVAGEVSYDTENRQALFKPSQKLKPNKRYTVLAERSMQSCKHIDLYDDYSWSFVTAPEKIETDYDYGLYAAQAVMWSQVNHDKLQGFWSFGFALRDNRGLGWTWADMNPRSSEGSSFSFLNAFVMFRLAKDLYLPGGDYQSESNNDIYLLAGFQRMAISYHDHEEWSLSSQSPKIYRKSSVVMEEELYKPAFGFGWIMMELDRSTVSCSSLLFTPLENLNWGIQINSFAGFGIAPYADLIIALFFSDNPKFSNYGLGVGVQFGF